MMDTQPIQAVPRYKNPRTFFGDKTEDSSMQQLSCRICGAPHDIWKCREFIQKGISERWNVAKLFHLCFPCVAEGHPGKSCPQSRQCGQNWCQESHHRLLHSREGRQSHGTEPKSSVFDTGCSNELNVSENPSNKRVTFGTEGNDRKEQIKMTTQDNVSSEFVALLTVPVMLKNGDRHLTVNALLDDASTKTYVTKDVAEKLCLHGKTDRVTVNVLNGQIETFDTKTVHFELESVNRNVNMNVTAYTANRVTGNLNVVDWNNYKKRWPYLEKLDFPQNTSRPIVNILIGLECAELHCAVQEIRGRPGEPIARLTPLGWTCIGNLVLDDSPVLRTNFAYTYFLRDQSVSGQPNIGLNRCREIEDTSISPLQEISVEQNDEQIARKNVQHSIPCTSQVYQVSIPWKQSDNNHEKTRQMQDNIARRLKMSPQIAGENNKVKK